MSEASERDRILGRVRTTTAVTGIGAVLAGGVLAGWLGHAATADGTASSTVDSTAGSGTTADPDDDGGLTAPDTLPQQGGSGSGGQPGVTSGGS